MSAEKAPFYLYARKREARDPVWYVKYRNSEDGRILSAVCTGKADREQAYKWAARHAVELASDDRERQRKSKDNLTFEEWAEPWWRFETCPYIRERTGAGFNISKAYAIARRSYLDRHLIPEFGQVPIKRLTPVMFRDFKQRLQAAGELRPATINRILGTARVMFNYAVRMGELQYSPVTPVTELKEDPRERGILSLAELAALFGSDSLKKAWNNDPKHYALNLLSAGTGMRLGECQALQVQAIDPSGYIDVAHSWDDAHGLSAPKWGSRRFVPVPTRAAQAINSLLALNRWGEPLPTDFIFWGKDRDTPITKTAILKQTKAALRRIGITEEQRAARNLVFHSYRHGFNTLIRGKVPDEQLRRVTGHKTMSMSDNYDHAAPEHLQDVKLVQDELFSFRKEVAKGKPRK